MSGELPLPPGLSAWDRAMRAVEAVRERLVRARRALERANVAHAVIGAHAVAAWVATADPAAVRNTPNVDLLVRRPDHASVRRALAAAGFLPRDVENEELFFDPGQSRPREALRVLFAGEMVRPHYLLPAPEVTDSRVFPEGLRVLELVPLVRMKLTSYRTVDRVHLQDLIGVGLIDATWPARFPPELGARLQQLLDDPNG